jgi:NMD protein affecting ribosome stability and mRNA decay
MTPQIEQEIRDILNKIICRHCNVQMYAPHQWTIDEERFNQVISELLSLISQHYIPKSELPSEEEIAKIIHDTNFIESKISPSHPQKNKKGLNND